MDYVELPAWNADLAKHQRAHALLEQLDDWVQSDALEALARAWGAQPPKDNEPALLYQWYAEFSARTWDFRAGKERNMATVPDLDPKQVEVAIRAAKALGLFESRPPRRNQYDYVLVLGGLVRACVTRPQYARELIDAGLDVGQVVALGGFRPLKGDEVNLATSLGITASNEFEAMLAGVKGAFAIPVAPDVERSGMGEPGNNDWAVATFDGYPATVVAAPSTDPGSRRANTADTFAWWVQRNPGSRGSHVLLITSPIYVPYQGSVAIQNLGIPNGISVETVGISESAADLGEHTQSFTAANYVQEVRSAIVGHLALRESVVRYIDQVDA